MSPDTHQMTKALVESGVISRPTVTEQLWRIIKDQPGITVPEMAKRAAHMPYGTLGTTLRQMVKRGMLYTTESSPRSMGGSGAKKSYYTDMDSYVLLPMPKDAGKSPKEARKEQLSIQSTPKAENVPEARKTASGPTDLIDVLTIAQARELYALLHKMFGR